MIGACPPWVRAGSKPRTQLLSRAAATSLSLAPLLLSVLLGSVWRPQRRSGETGTGTGMDGEEGRRSCDMEWLVE